MISRINRVQFLRGDFKAKENPLRPPWAIDENLFTETCSSCGECISQCPTHVIKPARANLPVIDFTAGECLFCGQCVNVCKPQALVKTEQDPAWFVQACINNVTCIAHQGAECRSCYDPCESHAISMSQQPGGISIPVIRTESCTGCGACFSVCPVQAITMSQPQ